MSTFKEKDEEEFRAMNAVKELPPTIQHTVLMMADEIVHGDRNTTYGSADESFNRIATFWNGIISKLVIDRCAKMEWVINKDEFDQLLNSADVARMMILLKVSRSMGNPDIDNWVDIAGYASLAAFCES